MNYRYDGLVHIARRDLAVRGVMLFCGWLDPVDCVNAEPVTDIPTCLQCLYTEQRTENIRAVLNSARR